MGFKPRKFWVSREANQHDDWYGVHDAKPEKINGPWVDILFPKVFEKLTGITLKPGEMIPVRLVPTRRTPTLLKRKKRSF